GCRWARRHRRARRRVACRRRKRWRRRGASERRRASRCADSPSNGSPGHTKGKHNGPSIALGPLSRLPSKRFELVLVPPADELAEHVGKNAAVLVVVHLFRRVDPRHGLELLLRAVLGGRTDRQRRARLETAVEPDDVEGLEARQAERLARVAIRKL